MKKSRKKDLIAHPTVSHGWGYDAKTKLYPCQRIGCNIKGRGFYDKNNVFQIEAILDL